MLVFNTGSSSIKFAVYSEELHTTDTIKGSITNIGTNPVLSCRSDKIQLDRSYSTEDCIRYVAKYLEALGGDFSVIGHRVVHGGTKYKFHTKVTSYVKQDLKSYIPLAPLHQPYNIAGIEILEGMFPHSTHIAFFDTAFHSTNDELSYRYAVSTELYNAGVRKYGFHGLSYEYVSSKIQDKYENYIIAHIGSGASMCAVKEGKSVDSTMGMTALEGLPMGTRCGSIDPGVILYMMQELSMTLEQVQDALYRESGLLGLSGNTNDMKVLCESNETHDRFTVEHFCYNAAKQAAKLVVALGSIDAVVFTGGIGENSQLIRDKIVSYMKFLGHFAVEVVKTDEELVIAQHIKNSRYDDYGDLDPALLEA